MLRVIPEGEMRRRTEALLAAIPEPRREAVAREIRRYAHDMDERYQQLGALLSQQLGEGAEIVIKEMNKPNFDWDRTVADRIEGKQDT
jgi:hypothetical protein